MSRHAYAVVSFVTLVLFLSSCDTEPAAPTAPHHSTGPAVAIPSPNRASDARRGEINASRPRSIPRGFPSRASSQSDPSVLTRCIPDRPAAQDTDHTFPARSIVSRLELFADPGNIMHGEIVPVRITARASDPLGHPVDGVQVIFNSNHGRFFTDREHRNSLNPAARVTGTDGDPGTAAVWWWWNVYDWDPYMLEITILIGASVAGSDDIYADPVFIFITRPPG